MRRRSAIGCVFALWAGLTIWACDSDTSDEHAKAKAVGEGCSINSDCAEPYVCVFERCHVQCKKTLDCPAPERCVKWQNDIGVCQFDDEATCNQNKPCHGAQVCAGDGKCRDLCSSGEDCLSGQACADSVCAEPGEVVNGHLFGWDGGTGTGGAGGDGGSSGSAGSSGAGGESGGGSGGTDASTGGSSGVGGDAGTDAKDGAVSTLPKPIAYWPLDAVGGGMLDVVGALDGEYIGAPTSEPGKVGQSILFNVNGSGDRGLVSYETTLDSPTALGVSVWINSSITLNVNAGTHVIVVRSGIMALRYAAGKLEYQLFANGSGSVTVSAAATLANNTWHHVVAGYDATNDNMLHLYLDGLEVGSQEGLGSIKTGSGLIVGVLDTGASSFIGKIDELSLYKQSLSQTDVDALYAAGNAGTKVTSLSCSGCPKPFAHFPMDDDPDPSVPDLAGTNPGVAVAGVLSVAGRVGTAVMFVDDGDYVNIPHSTVLDPPTAMTIAMWVRPTTTLGSVLQSVPFFNKAVGPIGYALTSPGSNVDARFSVGGIFASSPSATFEANAWRHVAGTWDGATISYYIDGDQKGQSAKTGPYTPLTSDAWIGSPAGGTAKTFFGTADEVVLYDVALTSDQVKELFDLGNAGTPVPH